MVHLLQDKVVSLLLSNYLLWPVTNHIMSKFVPKQHRAGATHVVTVCPCVSASRACDTGALCMTRHGIGTNSQR